MFTPMFTRETPVYIRVLQKVNIVNIENNKKNKIKTTLIWKRKTLH